MPSIHYIPTHHSGLGSVIDDLKRTLEKGCSELERKNLALTVDQLLQANKLFPAERAELISLRDKILNPTTIQKTFLAGFTKAFYEIDGEQFAKRIPKFLTLTLCSAVVSWFLWDQSVSLYEATKFTSPSFAAAGAALMIIGFAGYHGFTRSKLAFFLCLYIGGYEAYTVISGTVKSEEKISMEAVEVLPEIALLKEKATQAKQSYETVKTNYEEPTSKVFHNQWYKTKFLTPVWNEYQTAQETFSKERNLVLAKQSSTHVTWLKVLYRLGLVFLSMILIHQLTRSIADLTVQRQKNFS